MKKTHPAFNIFIITLIVLGGIFVAQFIGLLLSSGIFGLGIEELAASLSNPSAKVAHTKEIFWIVQSFSLGLGMGGGVFLYQKFVARTAFNSFDREKNIQIPLLALAVFIFVAAFAPSAELMYWNSQINFGSFDESIRAMEKNAEIATKVITDMQNFGEMFVVLLVIAVIPAFAEELLFRALLQNELQRWFKKPHLAIWLTAIIFSAIHFQFLGFLPRMFLGLLLGYLYFWSGNLGYSIAGHFANNAFQVLLLFAQQQKWIATEIEHMESIPLIFLLPSILLLVALVWFFYINIKRRN
ncbi:MAG: CPBP family intramembrane glutamic endopeptidase [Thermonemataceae bacterium]|nr:CPBP family intramembrane glutamic endopeptidase [Thermonemataceae bacterium]